MYTLLTLRGQTGFVPRVHTDVYRSGPVAMGTGTTHDGAAGVPES